jgi:hypothetical protein
MTDDSQAPEQTPQSEPPISAQQLMDEMVKLLEGDRSEEEERELELLEPGDEKVLEYFLLRCALRRCIRTQLASDRDEQSSLSPTEPGDLPPKKWTSS